MRSGARKWLRRVLGLFRRADHFLEKKAVPALTLLFEVLPLALTGQLGIGDRGEQSAAVSVPELAGG